jgi:DNA-binding NtrC family response regulator
VSNKTNILVIDEDVMVRQTLSYALEDDGFQAFSAANRREAVSHFGSQRIHVLLMDLNPRLENPRETFDCLTALQPSLQVIAMTSRPEQEIDNPGAAQYDALFEKPLDFPGLIETIRKLV